VGSLGLLFVLDGLNREVRFASGIILAISLFICRVRFRSFYGIAEIGFGLYVLWNACTNGFNFNQDFNQLDFAHAQLDILVIQAFGAIYVMIRGMDNWLQGLPEPMRKTIEQRIQSWRLVPS
jgi:hypothetical protein